MPPSLVRVASCGLALTLAAACSDDAPTAATGASASPGATSADDTTAATAPATVAGPTSTPPATGAGPPTEGAPTTTTAAPPPLAQAAVTLTVVTVLDRPTTATLRPGDPLVYVGEQGGRVVAVDPRDGATTTVLDLGDRVRAGGEQGLLGLAFSPDGATLYVHASDTDGDTSVSAFPFAGGVADGADERPVLAVDQPYPNHNGGDITFGPDGYLYLGLGDGGGGGDPERRAQDLGTVLGKVLRIAPRPDGGYDVPPDNPFVDVEGAEPEIFAFGLRNPWRLSFDGATGDLWIADVGQAVWEEVDVVPAGSPGGQNFGWNRYEGPGPFAGQEAPEGNVLPVHAYTHDDTGGCSITGGFVYRGSAVPALTGAYVFSDYCEGFLAAIRVDDGAVVEEVDLGVDVDRPTAFARDQAGELYVLSHAGALLRVDPA